MNDLTIFLIPFLCTKGRDNTVKVRSIINRVSECIQFVQIGEHNFAVLII